jgi:hypothetical protein
MLEMISPKTECFSLRSGCYERHIKNWLLLVQGPELAILSTPGKCLSLGLNSSWNAFPKTL